MRRLGSGRPRWLWILIGFLLVAFAAQAEAAFDWQKHKGTRLRVLTYSLGWSDWMKEQVPEFEKLTGMKVDFEIIPGAAVAAFTQKLNVEFAARSKNIDVYVSYAPQFSIKYYRAGWYEPLDRYVRDPALLDPAYDFGDFIDGAVKTARVEGTLVGIPFSPTTTLLYYRKDLFQQHGVRVPETFDDLEAAAKKLTLPAQGIVGIVYRGRGRDAVSQWAHWFLGAGAYWWDAQGKPGLASPEALWSFEHYGKLLREYGPKGPANISRLDAQNLFAAGKAAMWIDTTDGVATLQDAAKTPVADRVGYAVPPGGKAGKAPNSFSLYLSLSSFSEKKEAAWFFIQWATSKDVLTKGQVKGVPSPRRSSWNNPAFLEDVGKKFPDYPTSFVKALEVGRLDWLPLIEGAQESRDAIGVAITTGIQGGNVKEAAERANQEFGEILAREPKGK